MRVPATKGRCHPNLAVLGIDAAWTATNPSGVALVEETDAGWVLRALTGSYADFGALAGVEATHSANGLLAACVGLCGREPELVAVDMPLAHSPITTRREADNAISRAYGARHCSTHTPSATRPGKISDDLRAGFQAAGYTLATDRLQLPALIEVYPHPALVELTGAARRLPYKVSKIRNYWPDLTPSARRVAVIDVWEQIVVALEAKIRGVAAALPLPVPTASGRSLKAFEDQLDAVVCAWSGICALEGVAKPFGDADAAVWIPLPVAS